MLEIQQAQSMHSHIPWGSTQPGCKPGGCKRSRRGDTSQTACQLCRWISGISSGAGYAQPEKSGKWQQWAPIFLSSEYNRCCWDEMEMSEVTMKFLNNLEFCEFLSNQSNGDCPFRCSGHSAALPKVMWHRERGKITLGCANPIIHVCRYPYSHRTTHSPQPATQSLHWGRDRVGVPFLMGPHFSSWCATPAFAGWGSLSEGCSVRDGR